MTDRGKEIVEKLYKQNFLNGFDFSILIQDIAIPEGMYVIGTGNWENVNAAVAAHLVRQIKKHPIIWRLFFMF